MVFRMTNHADEEALASLLTAPDGDPRSGPNGPTPRSQAGRGRFRLDTPVRCRDCLLCGCLSRARLWRREALRDGPWRRYAYRCPRCGRLCTPDLAPLTSAVPAPRPEVAAEVWAIATADAEPADGRPTGAGPW
jgi:hypothetical protein